MPKVEENGIIFEYPDDVEVPGAKAAEKSDEQEVEIKEAPVAKQKAEVKVEAKVDDIDLEIEDDTPAEDRNKEPLPKEVVNELENDTLEDYSEKVRTQIGRAHV